MSTPTKDTSVLHSVQAQHQEANISALSDQSAEYVRTQHPDAQWYLNP